MMNKNIFFKTTLVLVAIASQQSFAAARAGKALYVGSGLAYPTLNHSLFVNPAGLVDSPKASLQASYLLDPGKIHASLMSGSSSVGFGVGYRQVGSSSTEEFGLGARLNILTLGATMRTQEFEAMDGDLSGTFDFGSMRLAVIGRGASAGFDRADVGLGFTSGALSFGFDAKKPLIVGSKIVLFDASLSANSGSVSAGFGYTFSYDGNDVVGGDVHAGMSLELSKGVAAEAFYRPASQEWSPGDWVVGARFAL